MTASFGLLVKHHIRIELSLWRRRLVELIIIFIMLIVILTNPIAYSKRALYSRNLNKLSQLTSSHKLEDINILTSLVDSKRERTKFRLVYAPSTPFTREIVETVVKELELNGSDGYLSTTNLQNQFDERGTLAAIIFDNIDFKDIYPPKVLSVSIRFPSEFRTLSPFLTEDRLWVTRCSGIVNPERDNINDPFINQDVYIREGFLQIQHLIFVNWLRKMIQHYSKENVEDYYVTVFNIRLRKNEGCTVSDTYNIPSFIFNFLYLLPFVNIIRNLAQQLRDNVMTHQWYYGYSFSKQYTAMFLVLMLRFVIMGVLIVLIVFIYWSVQDNVFSPLTLLTMILFIVIFSIELIVTSFVFAQIFRDPINSVLLGVLVWLFNYALFEVILRRYWDVHDHYVLIILLIFFSNQMPHSIQLFHRLMNEPNTITAYDILMLFGTAVTCVILYLTLLLLLQWRLPGRLISRRLLHGKRRKYDEKDNTLIYLGRSPSFHNFEFGDVGSEELARLRHVYTKHHDSERKILKNVSMRIYKNEIYVILGHIGSGKLTLLRIICGLKYPMRGTVLILGKDLYENMHASRQLMDFRSLENGQSVYLTVERTINYHVQVKLQHDSRDRYEMERIKWLELLEKYFIGRNACIGHLTYGERRLVSLCCALAGDTKIICMEEPTRHLKSREAQIFWAIVAMEKEGRAFIVATHSIEEAEAIADRIGILSMGVLEASGTPFFLRAKFSSSVELVLIKKPHVPDTPITEFIGQYIPNVEPENEIGDSLTYKIPAMHRPHLQKMLIHLENDRKMLGIDNIRVVGSELSDIYMKLVTSFRLQRQIIPDVTQTFKYSVVSRKQLRKQQMRAMLYKKMITNAPNVWPIIMIFACFLLIVIITRLAIVLDVPQMRTNTIDLGFKGASKSLVIPDIKDCGYVDIVSMAKTPRYKQLNSRPRIFASNSFVCRKNDFNSDVKQQDKFNSIGAVELHGERDLYGYIIQDTFHSAPIMLNLLQNIIIKLTFGKDTNFLYLVDNHPMPTPLSMKINLLDNQLAHINAPLVLGCVLPLVVSVFIVPLVEERISQLRTLQVIAGIGLEIYWGVNLFWDLFTYIIYSIIIVIIMTCNNIGDFGAYENILLLLLLTVYGLSALPITYIVSMYVNKSIVRAFMASVMFHGITGIVLYILYWDVANSNAVFFYGACMSPGFALLDGVSNIYIRCLEKHLCTDKCKSIDKCTPQNMHETVANCRFESYFKWGNPGILQSLTFMLLAAFFALLLIFWIELHRKEKKFHSSKDLHKLRTATYPFDDSDVADVKQKIAEADLTKCKQSVFLVDQVENQLPQKGNKLHTVSFALNKYMSMGIFGPRNAGKSHLIRQLVGIDGFSFGEIYVRGLDFKYDLDTILGYVGYCPQHLGVHNELTPREHIRLLCMIRGVTEHKISEKMHDLCLMLNMTGWMHRKCSTLTPEKLRKLNVALSLVAYNKIFVLDEPTRGMPATSRREIWNILRYLRYCGKTIIFSSTDELECKVLADFIILYENSEMLAIGSMQYLRYKYSHGFYLEVRLVRDGSTLEETEINLRKDVENLSRFINFLHDKSELVGRLHNWFKFYIPVGHIVYSYLYGAMEKNKMRLNVYDYCIYQSNMNSVITQVQETRTELKRRIRVQDEINENTPRTTVVTV